jgi:uncharacterized heparinase superfamily protein
MMNAVYVRLFANLFRKKWWKLFGKSITQRPMPKPTGSFSFITPKPWSNLKDADDALSHNFSVFGHSVQLPEKIDWHFDPLSNYTWDRQAPSHSFNFLNAPKADVKVVWEISRFQQLPVLAAAFLQTRSEKYLCELITQVESWIEQNPLGFGVHWVVPMEASIRAVNWITTLALLKDDAPPTLVKSMLRSLSEHAAYIYWNIEFGKKNGNHYLSNGMGLLWLGVFLGEKKYVRKGLAIVEESMREQVYDDGVDYEKSVSYHGLVLEMFELSRLVCEANGIELSPEFYRKLRAMRHFLAATTKPNGERCNIGDDDSGSVLHHSMPIQTIQFDEHRQALSELFKYGGFAVLRHCDTHLFFDFGDIGMQGYGGHGHNDTLSFELFFNGEHFIVDSGTFNYTLFQDERQQFRSIEAHNTIQIDGKELVPFRNLWSIAADTTQPKLIQWTSHEQRDEITAEINNNGVRHQRTICFDKASGVIDIMDKLSGKGKHSAVSRLHFHPSLSPSLDGNTIVAGNARISIEGASRILLKESQYSKGYYQKVRNVKAELCIEFETAWQGRIKFEQLKP